MATFPLDMLAFVQQLASCTAACSGTGPGICFFVEQFAYTDPGQGKAPEVPALAPLPPANFKTTFRAFAAMACASPNPTTPQSEVEPVDSEAAHWERITFKLSDKPPGTARRSGKNRYNVQKVLGLERAPYKLIKRVTKHIQDKLLKVFPEFHNFDDPYWPINTFLLIVLQSSSQVTKRTLDKVKRDKEVEKKKIPTLAGAAPGLVPANGGMRPKVAQAADKDPVEMFAHNTTMMSIQDDAHDNDNDGDADADDNNSEGNSNGNGDGYGDDNDNDEGSTDKDMEVTESMLPVPPSAPVLTQADHHGHR
ncbi:hypothetical protein FRC06_005268 [Ceratobasidium sp. 370]|nr:hypothetical protein FRC06_005268 [Ceratobasidium sp. 370]